ncbi:MAG TPA: hypothetical protein VLD36_20805 [Burkholderiales bacterium]|jgi:hypothetical protein|nr:hypothetical protein [Burkholderiales bacterium]
MPNTPRRPDPEAATIPDFEAANPLRPDATRLGGTTRRGKPCELIDNSGDRLPAAELQAILDALIREDRFGFAAATAAGGSTLDLARRESAHIQVEGRLYRLIVFRYQARIERF